VLAVTAPFAAAGPKALTQSPRARSLEEADCVALTVVEPEVVMVRSWVFGVAGFLALELFEFAPAGPEKLPNDSVVPEIAIVDPVTAVTFPVATDIEASCLRKLLAPEPPLGKLGRPPLVALP